MRQIHIPNDWAPRPHQLPLWNALHDGVRRAVGVWHRRAGKDSVSANFTACEAFETPGLYWHCGPTQQQVRKFVWNNIDAQGRRVIDQVYPKDLVVSSDKQQMLRELKGGSIWQCVGSNNYDSIVGANPRGVVFSEWSLCDPKAWDLIRPILAENGGWAIFIYTPRGKNHGERLYKMAAANPNWFCQKLTVDDTEREDGTRVLSPEDIQEEIDAGMSDAMVQQEFYCSFDAFNEGAILGAQLAQARHQGRIGMFPVNERYPVHTSWDLGVNDHNAIWLWQAYENRIFLVDFYDNQNKSMGHYIGWLRQWERDNGVALGRHLGPHDINKRVYTDEADEPRTRKEIAEQDHDFRFEVVAQHGLGDQHERGRALLKRTCINEIGGAIRGLDAMSSYEREWDERRLVYLDRPVHNWASHGASAFLTLACGFEESMDANEQRRRAGRGRQQQVVLAADFDPLG